MTTFFHHLTFARTTLRTASDSLHADLFGGEAICIRRLDRQVSHFLTLLVMLAAILGLSLVRAGLGR